MLLLNTNLPFIADNSCCRLADFDEKVQTMYKLTDSEGQFFF